MKTYQNLYKEKLKITVIATGFEEKEEVEVLVGREKTEEEVVRPQLESTPDEEEENNAQAPKSIFESHETQDENGSSIPEVPTFLRNTDLNRNNEQ